MQCWQKWRRIIGTGTVLSTTFYTTIIYEQYMYYFINDHFINLAKHTITRSIAELHRLLFYACLEVSVERPYEAESRDHLVISSFYSSCYQFVTLQLIQPIWFLRPLHLKSFFPQTIENVHSQNFMPQQANTLSERETWKGNQRLRLENSMRTATIVKNCKTCKMFTSHCLFS